MRFLAILRRSLTLRCPVCGEGNLYAGIFKMNTACSRCGRKFEREPGFFLGAIYINYGLTSLVAAIVYPLLSLTQILPRTQALAVTLVWVVLFPLAFFRHARSLWLGMDEFYDPMNPSSGSK